MYTQSDIMFMYAETGIHVGGGDSVGAIDLAIQREKYTDFPMAAGSGVKGAVRAWFEQKYGLDSEKVKLVFGPDDGNAGDHAGAASFSDARILLFPVRSLKGVFVWITCPAVLHRLKRDLSMIGKNANFKVPDPADEQAMITSKNEITIDGTIVLEEYSFQCSENDDMKSVADWLKKYAMPQLEEYEFWRERLDTHLVVLPDDDFRDFVKYSTEVQTRIKLDNKTKTAVQGSLFYQENLPGDSLMYSLSLAQHSMGSHSNGSEKLTDQKVLEFVKELQGLHLQIGGDETIGKGLMCIHFTNGGSNE